MKLQRLTIGLRAKTFFGLIIPISLLFVFLTFATESYLTEKIRENYIENVSLAIDSSKGMLAHHTLEEVRDDHHLILEPLAESNPIIINKVTILRVTRDDDLVVLAVHGADGYATLAPWHQRAHDEGQRVSVEEGGYLKIAAPITFVDGTEGVLAASVDLVSRNDLMLTLRTRSFWVVGLGLVMLSGIIFLGLEHSFLRPIHRLQQAAVAAKSGDFKAPATITNRDELGDLTRSIDSMTKRLDSHTQALERRLSELTVLYNISKVASSSLDLGKTLGVILESAIKVTDATSGFIMLDTQEEEANVNLELKASRGIYAGDKGKNIVSKEIAEHVAESGGPLLLIGDITRMGFTNKQEFKDAIYAPIGLAEKTIGVIGLVDRQDGTFGKKDVQLVSTLANQASGVINTARLFADLQESYFSTIKALAAAIDAKDPYTRGHSSRVAGYSELIAAQLDCSAEERQAIKIAAHLHDIGKIGIEEQILRKPQSLAHAEWEIIRDHPNISARILASVSFLKETIPMVSGHHEQFDGSGYPRGLAGKEIPLGARVIAVADSFDAMTSDRPYRQALSHEKALAELKAMAGTQFDAKLVEIFIDHVDQAEAFIDELVVPSKTPT